MRDGGWGGEERWVEVDGLGPLLASFSAAAVGRGDDGAWMRWARRAHPSVVRRGWSVLMRSSLVFPSTLGVDASIFASGFELAVRSCSSVSTVALVADIPPSQASSHVPMLSRHTGRTHYVLLCVPVTWEPSLTSCTPRVAPEMVMASERAVDSCGWRRRHCLEHS